MDVGPTLAKGHPRSLDHGCNVRSTCRCSVYPAIHTTTRSLLRSSSTHEPSDPPLRVVLLVVRLHEGDAISGLRLCYPRKSPPIWGGGRNPLNGLFGAGGRPGEAVRWRPVDPTRRRLAPWFDRVAVSPSLSGRGSAPDWGRPAEREGWDGDGVADVPQPGTAPKGGFGCGTHGGAVTLMILPQVHLRKPCYDFYFL